MKKHPVLIIFSIVLVLTLISALWLFRSNIISLLQTGNLSQPVQENPISKLPSMDEFAFSHYDNVTQIIPKWAGGEFIIYRSDDSKDILLINYICPKEHNAKFYQMDLRTCRISKLFEVAGDVNQARIMNHGKGLLCLTGYYSSSGDPSERKLFYMEKGNGTRKELQYPNLFYMSPDEKRLILGKSHYLYEFETDTYTETGIESDWIGPSPVWHSQSRYVILNDSKVYDTETKTIKDFDCKGAALTNFQWSPDGTKLAFLAQTGQYSNYRAEFENDGIFFSDMLAVYDLKDDTLTAFPFKDSLSPQYVWANDGSKIVASTIPLDVATFYIKYLEEKSYGGSPEEQYYLDLHLVDLKTNQESAILSDQKQSLKINGLEALLSNRLFFAGRNPENLLTIFGYHLESRQVREIYNEEEFVFFKAFPYKDKIFLAGYKHNRLVGQDLKVREVFKPTSYNPDIVTFPACNKVVFVDGERGSEQAIVILEL